MSGTNQPARPPQRPAPPVHPSLRRFNSSQPEFRTAELSDEAVNTPPLLDSSHLVTSSDGILLSTPVTSTTTPLARPLAPPAPIGPQVTADASVNQKEEEELDESQLRRLYEEEEIDRFLRVFTDYVSEVRAPHKQQKYSDDKRAVPQDAPAADLNLSENEDEGWIKAQQELDAKPPISSAELLLGNGLAERVASYIISLLPPPPPPDPPFTVKRLRLTIRRLFLAFVDIYYPSLIRAIDLITWKDPKTSLKYCILYWFLWYHNLLIAGLTLWLLYGLLRRKFLVYPTLGELRSHRRWQDRADDFSKHIVLKLADSPATHVQGVWKDIKRRFRKKGPNEEISTEASSEAGAPSVPQVLIEESVEDVDTTGVRTEDVPMADSELAGPLLEVAAQIADIHERIGHLLLWHHPQASSVFALILVGLFFFSLLPIQYIVKLAGLAFGVLFWHAVPVIIAIPPQERRRIPPPLSMVPTDAEYAMELISQRVAQGLPVRPKQRKREKVAAPASQSRVNLVDEDASDNEGAEAYESLSIPHKWTERFVEAKSWTGGMREVLKDGKWKDSQNWPPSPLRTVTNEQDRVQTFTYPAQSRVPGIITLTGTSLFFTPLTSSNPTITIDLKTLTGVKRNSLAKGMKLRWFETQENEPSEEREEKFLWVSGRDDLFARLIGMQSKRWLHV